MIKTQFLTNLQALSCKRIDGVSAEHANKFSSIGIKLVPHTVQITLRVGLQFSEMTLHRHHLTPQAEQTMVLVGVVVVKCL